MLDVPKAFTDGMKSVLTIRQYCDLVKPMKPFTVVEQSDYNIVINCHIYNGKLGDDKVIDHNHVSGNYRGTSTFKL